ncbi:hypothetical protein AX13_01475 [Comamonas aquatica DA1877]|uniref:UDP-glucose/GDP-mannose dehydrogenase C-terminal domain-containing protein n=2 Tax=Comamonas aquatica TaxID=225991 RepID=A0A014NKY4_9BURK|nr:hypothetical protein AX13_01475 [Comamonas aquatica DA1877]
MPDKLQAADVLLLDYEVALQQAHVMVLLVDHAEFKADKPTFTSVQRLVDAKGIWG